MRKIYLIIISVLLVVVILFLAIPFAMSLWLQKKYPQVIANINSTYHTSFRLNQFKAGWFQSYAEIVSSDENPLIQYNIKQKLYQGPIIYYRNVDGKKCLTFAPVVVRSSSHQPNVDFDIISIWQLNDVLKNKIQAKHWVSIKDQERIDWSDAKGWVNYQPSTKQLSTHLKVGKVNLFVPNPEREAINVVDFSKLAEVQNLKINLKIKQTNQLWYGDRRLQAEKVLIQPYGGSLLTIDHWNLKASQIEHASVTDVNIDNQIENIQMDNFFMNQFKMNLALKDMDTASLAKLAKEGVRGVALHRLKVYGLLMKLFSKGMTVELNQLEFSTKDGPVNAHAKISSRSLLNIDAHADLDLPKALVQKGLLNFYEIQKNAHPELNINPESLAQKRLNDWLNQHILVPKDDQVSMVMEFEKGKLTINGEKAALQRLWL